MRVTGVSAWPGCLPGVRHMGWGRGSVGAVLTCDVLFYGLHLNNGKLCAWTGGCRR